MREEMAQFLQPVPTTSIHRRAVLMAAAWRRPPSHVIGTSWEDGATCTWVCACPFQNRLHVNLRFLTDEEQSFPVKGLHKLLGKQTNQPWWPARYCRFRRDTADDTYPSYSSHPSPVHPHCSLFTRVPPAMARSVTNNRSVTHHRTLRDR